MLMNNRTLRVARFYPKGSCEQKGMRAERGKKLKGQL